MDYSQAYELRPYGRNPLAPMGRPVQNDTSRDISGWYVDGLSTFALGQDERFAVRPEGYRPFQSINEPDGRHAYDPDALYPRIGAAADVSDIDQRIAEYRANRPLGLPQHATFEFGVRDRGYYDQPGLGCYPQNPEREEYRDIFNEMLDRRDNLQGMGGMGGGYYDQPGLGYYPQNPERELYRDIFNDMLDQREAGGFMQGGLGPMDMGMGMVGGGYGGGMGGYGDPFGGGYGDIMGGGFGFGGSFQDNWGYGPY
ncbi:hypothetical protein Q7P37_006744 [Cladosporium fusiforme]